MKKTIAYVGAAAGLLIASVAIAQTTNNTAPAASAANANANAAQQDQNAANANANAANQDQSAANSGSSDTSGYNANATNPGERG